MTTRAPAVLKSCSHFILVGLITPLDICQSHLICHISPSQESEYKKLGEEMLAAAWRTLNSPDWKLEKKLDNGDMVQVGSTFM